MAGAAGAAGQAVEGERAAVAAILAGQLLLPHLLGMCLSYWPAATAGPLAAAAAAGSKR